MLNVDRFIIIIIVVLLVFQASEVHQIGAESRSQVINTELSEGEMGVDCFCIAVDEEVVANSAVTLGQYVLYWKRFVAVFALICLLNFFSFHFHPHFCFILYLHFN